jgi:hypothetical protein
MVQSVAPEPGEIVLLSGHDLRRLLNPEVVIEALREAYAVLADNRGDQGARSASQSKVDPFT